MAIDSGGVEGGDAQRVAARTQALALSAWELAKTQRERADSPRARGVVLRTQQRLQAELEERTGVPPGQRSILLIREQSAEAILLLHGATGTPAEMRGVAEFLHTQGYTVWAPLLPGHAKLGPGLDEVVWRACLQEIRLRLQQLRELHRRVHVVGLSFGAALGIHLARLEKVESLVLLAPALVPRLPWPVRLLLRLGVHRLGLVRSRYGWNLQVLDAMERARPLISQLRAPVYAAQCADDERLLPASLRMVQKRVKHRASRFRLYPTGGHMILQAHGESSLHGEILNFLRGV